MNTFKERANFVKTAVTKNKGAMPQISKDNAKEGVTTVKLKEAILADMPAAIKQLNSLRAGSKDRRAVDVSFGQYAQDKWGFSPEDNTQAPQSLFEALQVDPSRMTVDSLMTMPEFEEGYRWLVPEVIREAIRLGLRKEPAYQSLIAGEETVTQPTVIMPHINMSHAMPKKLGETETIPTGNVSFGQKTVQIHKVGTGLTISDEVQQQVSINLLALYLQDVGTKVNLALDTLAISTLINGDQADGSEAAPVIGVEATNDGFTYYDLLRAWVRLGILGRSPKGMISNENPALEILQLPEFKGFNGVSKTQNINLKTPVPQTQDYWVHGAMPSDNKLMMVDTSSALIKLNLNALRVESERIVNRQLQGTYVTLHTGFASLFRDARLLIDKSQAFSAAGFPEWMNAAQVQKETFKA